MLLSAIISCSSAAYAVADISEWRLLPLDMPSGLQCLPQLLARPAEIVTTSFAALKKSTDISKHVSLQVEHAGRVQCFQLDTMYQGS